MKRGKVVCIGSCVADVLLAYVTPDVFRDDVTHVDSVSYLPGGDALNEAVILARLGHQSKLLTAVGDDIWGRYVKEYVVAAGVDTSSMVTSDRYPTTVSIVLIQPDGNRSFVGSDGTNTRYVPESIDWDAIRTADAVSVASLFTNAELDAHLPEILQAAREGSAIISGDVLCRKGSSFEDAKAYLHYFDFLFPNYDEAVTLTGGKTELWDIGEAILSYGVKNAVVKIGARGCYLHNSDMQCIVPTYHADTILDSTGAGDNFAAGFLAALLEGKDLREAAAFGNATGAVALGYVGATGLKSRDEVLRMMQNDVLVAPDSERS